MPPSRPKPQSVAELMRADSTDSECGGSLPAPPAKRPKTEVIVLLDSSDEDEMEDRAGPSWPLAAQHSDPPSALVANEFDDHDAALQAFLGERDFGFE